MKPNTRALLFLTLLLALAAAALVRWHGRPQLASQPATSVRPPSNPAVPTPEPLATETERAVAGLLADVRKTEPTAPLAVTPFTTNIDSSGALRFVGTEPGWSLGTLAPDVPVPEAARQFFLEKRAAFGLANPRIDLQVLRHDALPNRDIVRLQQTYGGVPIFAGQLVANVRNGSEVSMALVDPGTVFMALDETPLPLQPTVDAGTAAQKATAAMQRRNPLSKLETPDAASARLVIYSPEVLGFNGDAELAWEVTVAAALDSPLPAAALWLVSAQDGATLNYFNKLHGALNRQVFDMNSKATPPSTPTRANGGAATGIADVDNAYNFIGQVYNFFSTQNGRDSFNGLGATISANVRANLANANSGTGLGAMTFGNGFMADDVVAHEFTHKVIEFTSGLLYQNASGAINESLADTWGELFDQSNSSLTPSGTDTVANRWLMGEDVTNGPLRNMSNPPARGQPDRIGHASFRPPVTYPRGADNQPDGQANDDGFVHGNSGVGNKLAFLLCDGGSHNGVTVAGLGSAKVLDLYYEATVFFLLPASDWLDLNFILKSAAVEQFFSTAERQAVANGCKAVEIDQASHTVHLDILTNATNKIGIPEVTPDNVYGPFVNLDAAIAAAGTRGTVKIQGNSGDLVLPYPYEITKGVTLTTYDTYIAVNPFNRVPIPPKPVTIRRP